MKEKNHTPRSHFLQERKAWLFIGLYIVSISLTLLLGKEKLFTLFFSSSSLALGVYLYFSNPHLYVGFTWWIWFISSFIYRINEFLSGDTNPGAGQLIPALVTSISVLSLIKHLPNTYSRQLLPFLLSIMGVTYGFLVGIINGTPFRSNISSTLFIIAPILFGFHLLTCWPIYPKIKQATLQSFLWGCIIMSVYGILQRVSLPSWDLYYLINSNNADEIANNSLVAGAFSTTPGRQQFGGFVLASLILLLSQGGSLISYSTAGVGAIGMLLSQARASWLGWVIAFSVLFMSLKQRLQVRTVLAVTVSAIVFIPLALTEPFSTIIAERIGTFSNLEYDNSLVTRREAFSQISDQALNQIFGLGIGLDIDSISSISNYDGSIFQMLFFLGWFGVLFFLAGMLLAILKLFENYGTKWDSFAYASRAIFLGIFVQIGFNFIFLGSLAIILWGFLGLTLAARSYYSSQLIGRE